MADLRPFEPRPAAQRPILCCGPPSPVGNEDDTIFLLNQRPSTPPPPQAVIHLADGAVLLFTPGRLPVGLRRVLDALYPPPGEYLQVDLWSPIVDPGALPEFYYTSTDSDSDSDPTSDIPSE